MRTAHTGKRWIEFFAVGGATFVLLPLAYLARRLFGVDDAEFAVSFLAYYGAHVINDPHFAVTYLLFYKNVRGRALGDVFDRRQRMRYWIAGFWVPAALAVGLGFALAARSAFTIGVVIQLMLFLVGWHYVKQGFGVLTVLSARRQVFFSSRERLALLAHCISGWLFARTNPRDLGRALESDGVIFQSWGHPPGLDRATALGFLLSSLFVAVVFLRRWQRRQPMPPLAALSGFLVSIWLWTAFSRLDAMLVYVIPALHSIQYLFFVLLLRRNQARSESGPPLFRPVSGSLAALAVSALLLGWLLFRGAPSWLDSAFSNPRERADIGPTPFLAAILSFVNIHHYFMDSVIWRRENPELRLLVEPPVEPARAAALA
jgi:hypothetical protein